ncbi:unnamed protein product [Pieris macdunnoughi]|uniref:FLYWCH-type domain-containing protein n=1 Tax=Pieris macdunnoughi TaxID=345717 RepID=A0A821QA31_9NEOP|nr:unnamed protein product [Pieris macdunnoughi]
MKASARSTKVLVAIVQNWLDSYEPTHKVVLINVPTRPRRRHLLPIEDHLLKEIERKNGKLIRRRCVGCYDARRNLGEPPKIATNNAKKVSQACMEYVTSQKGKILMKLHGYTYSLKSDTKCRKKNRWVCSTHQVKRCPGVILITDGKIVSMNENHNHPPKLKELLPFMYGPPAWFTYDQNRQVKDENS